MCRKSYRGSIAESIASSKYKKNEMIRKTDRLIKIRINLYKWLLIAKRLSSTGDVDEAIMFRKCAQL